jgi:hypothetical protein
MSDPSEDPGKTIDAVSKIVEAVQKILTTIHVVPPPERKARSGPLQVVGRLIFGLTVITALAASASGLIDWYSGSDPHWSTYVLRGALALLVLVCLGFSVLLVWHLTRHPTLLVNPGDLVPEAQTQWMEIAFTGQKFSKADLLEESVSKPLPPPTPPVPQTAQILDEEIPAPGEDSTKDDKVPSSRRASKVSE